MKLKLTIMSLAMVMATLPAAAMCCGGNASADKPANKPAGGMQCMSGGMAKDAAATDGKAQSSAPDHSGMDMSKDGAGMDMKMAGCCCCGKKT